MVDHGKRKASPEPIQDDDPPPSTQPSAKKARYGSLPINHPSSLRDLFPARRPDSTSASTSTSSNEAFNFKNFLKSQIKNDAGGARKETNDQGGKGPSSQARRRSASKRSTTSDEDAAPTARRIVDPLEYRVGIVMILPNGVNKVSSASERNQYKSPVNIRKEPIPVKQTFSYLSSINFAARSPEGFIFHDSWSEERVFEEIQTILPDACELMLQSHDAEHHNRVWLPCIKTPYNNKLVVSPAKGPYTGSSMRNIGMLITKRRFDQDSGIFIVSTSKIPVDSDTDSSSKSDKSNSDDDDSPFTQTRGQSKAKSKRAKGSKPSRKPTASSSQRTASGPQRPARTKKKQVEVINISDEDSEYRHESPSAQTDPVGSRTGSLEYDLDKSFSGFTLEPPGYDFGCTPDIPDEAIYRASSP
ncbi:hypothetical protein BJ165DRAFT_1410462 [Panaeolus papilionaceus]|nr:hypothetical protein BJ165DRAFT_1410462 [Panaeolus papilionaceus]